MGCASFFVASFPSFPFSLVLVRHNPPRFPKVVVPVYIGSHHFFVDGFAAVVQEDLDSAVECPLGFDYWAVVGQFRRV